MRTVSANPLPVASAFLPRFQIFNLRPALPESLLSDLNRRPSLYKTEKRPELARRVLLNG
jgi:hypothetical protein